MENKKHVDVGHRKKLDPSTLRNRVQDLKKNFQDLCVDFNTKGFLTCFFPEIGLETWPENRSEFLPLLREYRELAKRALNDSGNVGGMTPPEESRDVGRGMRPPEGSRDVGGGMGSPEGIRDVGGPRGTDGGSPSFLTLLNIPDEAARMEALRQYFYGNRNVRDMNPTETLEVRNRVASGQSLVEKLAPAAKRLEFLEKEQANSSSKRKGRS